MDEVTRTRETYRRIAGAYATSRQHRAEIQAQLTRFVQLLSPSARILDVGCGPGFETQSLAGQGLRAIGMDLSRTMLLSGRPYGVRGDFVQADMRHLPFSGSLDGLWVCASFLHLPRSEAPDVIREFYRILKPGGILHLAVKEGSGAEWVPQSYGQEAPRFFTYWRPQDLDELLVQNGLPVIDGWHNQGEKITWIVRFAQKT